MLEQIFALEPLPHLGIFRLNSIQFCPNQVY